MSADDVPDMNKELFDEFVDYSYIEKRGPGHYAIHELLREFLVGNIRAQEPEAWEKYHQRAYDYYNQLNNTDRYNKYYHAIALKEIKGLNEWEKAIEELLQRNGFNHDSIDLLLNAPADRALRLATYTQARYNSKRRDFEVFIAEERELRRYAIEKRRYQNIGDNTGLRSAEKAIKQIKTTRKKRPPFWHTKNIQLSRQRRSIAGLPMP